MIGNHPLFTVAILNMRTDERTHGALFKSAESAEDRARRGNEMARACKMMHLLYRALEYRAEDWPNDN